MISHHAQLNTDVAFPGPLVTGSLHAMANPNTDRAAPPRPATGKKKTSKKPAGKKR